MLYITTRDNNDAFTAHHALTEDCGTDGGRYIPFQMPHFTDEELLHLKDKSFGEILAETLNLFFSSRLTGWDVECCIGRNAFKLSSIHQKTIVAELWHNPQGRYAYIVDGLYKKLLNEDADSSAPSEWFGIAVRIAVLFGAFALMQKNGTTSGLESFDVCLPVDDFTALMAAYYARLMGLPVQKIICTEVDNSCLWDLVQRGTFNTWTGNNVCAGIERLLHATLGLPTAQNFQQKCADKRVFTLNEEQHNTIKDVFFCSVVGKTRISNIISSIYHSNNYIVNPHTALCHGGLQDFRAKTGNSRITLLIADESPMHSQEQISAATGVDMHILSERIRLS